MNKINSKKADNRGAGMVTVMVAIVFIGIMATSLCYMAYMNYLTKTMKYYSTDNFYTDEYALSDLTASLQQIVVSSDSIPAAINNLRVACTGSATGTTYQTIVDAGIPAEKIKKLYEGRPNILDAITNGEIDLIINPPSGKEAVNDDSYLRKAAIKGKIPYMTTMAAAIATAEGIAYVKANGNYAIQSLQAIHKEIKDK